MSPNQWDLHYTQSKIKPILHLLKGNLVTSQTCLKNPKTNKVVPNTPQILSMKPKSNLTVEPEGCICTPQLCKRVGFSCSSIIYVILFRQPTLFSTLLVIIF